MAAITREKERQDGLNLDTALHSAVRTEMGGDGTLQQGKLHSKIPCLTPKLQ